MKTDLKTWNSLLSEEVSASHQKSVFAAAALELKKNQEVLRPSILQSLFLRRSLLLKLGGAAFMALATWMSYRLSVPEEAKLNSDDLAMMAFGTDLQEDLELLEDLELMEDLEELELWTENEA